MIRKTLISLLAISLIACGAGKSNQQSTTQNHYPDLDIFANKYLNTTKNDTAITAISITAQCGNLEPKTSVAGVMGHDDLTRNIKDNDIFRIASITKSFVSVVLLQLENDPQYKAQQFNIDDSVGKWFPEYPKWQNITIRQLLNMTSGIPDYDLALSKNYVTPDMNKFKSYINPLDIVNLVYQQNIDFTPGTDWEYSNTNYLLLGFLVQKITGNDLGTEIKNRIIDKLQLKNTYYVSNLPQEIINPTRLVHGMWSLTVYTTLLTTSWDFGAGNMYSTSQDINRYAQALYNSEKLLTKDEFQKFTAIVSIKNHGQKLDKPTINDDKGFGLGIIEQYYNESHPFTYTYGGAGFGYYVQYYYDPINNKTLTLAVNGNPHSNKEIDTFALSILDGMIDCD